MSRNAIVLWEYEHYETNGTANRQCADGGLFASARQSPVPVEN